eukprot:766748-Hanusia_phi.AAC.5
MNRRVEDSEVSSDHQRVAALVVVVDRRYLRRLIPPGLQLLDVHKTSDDQVDVLQLRPNAGRDERSDLTLARPDHRGRAGAAQQHRSDGRLQEPGACQVEDSSGDADLRRLNGVDDRHVDEFELCGPAALDAVH